MASFAYKAVDGTGRERAGSVSAGSRAEAVELVMKDGLHPISLSELKERQSAPVQPTRRWRHVPQASVDDFTRELANLLGAGVSLSRALDILSRQAARPAARECWSDVREQVVGGVSLADALAAWPRVFAPVYVAMVRAGETGAFLDVVLGQIADFRAHERDLKGRVKAALVYPVVLAVLATAVLVFLLTYFIPRFSAVFAEFGGALPWLTRTIVNVSEVATHHWLWVAAVAVLAVVGLQRVRNSPAGRRVVEQMLLQLPGLGAATARFALVRFCRMLGTLAAAGVPLIAALRVAREAIGNETLAQTVTLAVDQVQRGSSLAAALETSPQLFPASVVEMVAVAEESGRLDTELLRLAGAYEGDLDRRLRMLVSLAEPALLFVMAAVIGTVVIGMLLPVFTLQDLVR